VERHADIPKYLRSNTKAIVGAVFPAKHLVEEPFSKHYYSFKNSFDEALNHILTYYKLSEKYKMFRIVEKGKDLVDVFERLKRKIGLIIGLEGAYPIREPDEFEIFYKLGVRVLGLTWNVDNQYAASCMTSKDYGLTSLGEKLVEKALDRGVVIDLAHASRNTMRDVLSISEKPIIISHVALRKFNDSPRNIDDEIIELVKRNRGVLGVFFVPEFIRREETSLKDIVEQIFYIKENFGIDIIAIGSDFFGTDKLPKGLENIGKINDLANALLEKGITRDEVEKIFYKNALRVFMENMKA